MLSDHSGFGKKNMLGKLKKRYYNFFLHQNLLKFYYLNSRRTFGGINANI